MQELELLAADALASARVDPSAPPHPVELAERLLGHGSVRTGPLAPPSGAALARVAGRWVMWVDLDGSRQARRWRVFHELGEWLLIQAGMFDAVTQEDRADALAAMLRAPRPAVLRQLADSPVDWARLAAPFWCSETSAALRYGEVTTEPVCVVGPTVRKRGRAWGWPEDPATAACLACVRATRLRDAPDRTALRVVA